MLYAIYLRPWTLLAALGDDDVPYAGTFDAPTATEVGSVRQTWKLYAQQIFPHALRTVRNFIANSWAESHKDADEDDILHGPAMTYAMTMDDVDKVLAADRNKDKKKRP